MSCFSLWLLVLNSEGTRLKTKLDFIWLQFCVASGEISTVKPNFDEFVLMKMYNSKTVTQSHAPLHAWRMKGTKNPPDRMVKLFWISMASCVVKVKYNSKVECLRLLIEEGRSYRLPYAGAGGRRQEEEEDRKRGFNRSAALLMNMIDHYRL